MRKLSGFRYRNVIRCLKRLGFQFNRQATGSHEIWFHPETKRYITIPNHPGDILEGTLHSILKQAAIDINLFLQQ